jgi:hypothetical protein
VKLSTRSPKYSSLALKRSAPYLKSELERIEVDVQTNPVDEAQHFNLKQVSEISSHFLLLSLLAYLLRRSRCSKQSSEA